MPSAAAAPSPRLRWLRRTLYAAVVLWMVVSAWNLANKHGILFYSACFLLIVTFGFVIAAREAVVILVWGVPCPSCRVWGMECVAAVTFGLRFYRCRACGQRCKRSGGDESHWFDASGMMDDDMYKPIPYFGPERRREALDGGLRLVGLFAGFVGLTLLAALLARWLPAWGFAIVEIALIGALFAFWSSRPNPKHLRPIEPPLWDRVVDSDRLQA